MCFVTFQSTDLGEACYMTQWYEFDLQSQKTILTIMERSKRPVVLTAGKFFSLTLGTLARVSV